MDNINFLQKKELFSLNTLKCLRNEYFFNECDLCFSRCSEMALGLQKEKIKLFENRCIECGDCIGICPTQALNLENFDTEEFILNFINTQKSTILEKVDIPSFGMLDSHHLLTIIIRKKENLYLEYDEACKNLEYLKQIQKQTNNFLQSINFKYKVELKKHIDELNIENKIRRNLFKTIFENKKQLQKETSVSNNLKIKNNETISKLILLKNSIKLIIEEVENIELSTLDSTLLFNKQIDFNSCTNCLDCINFCPTNALFQNEKKDSIYFQAGKCIGCNICDDICKEKAISNKEKINLIDFTFDKASKLVEFTYKTCQECNSVFIYKNGDIICPRCKDFRDNHSSMFTLAKDF
ncbi:4Fe-4S binding protein [Malaciobacter mytili]